MRFVIERNAYGELLPFIEDDAITDINWNGESLWLNDLQKGRYKVEGISLTSHFVKQFTQALANIVNVSFNANMPVLEAETEGLRISVLHESVTLSGRSISIRKTPAVMRLNRKKMEETKYCSKEIMNLLQNCIKAKMNTVICGLPGAGKTELLKMLTGYIPNNQRVITIEDTAEIRYRKINPGKDCVEIKVDEETLSYADAIKACLRQLPEWILLSEARSAEVKYLLESMSTGTHCLTTLHTDDVRKVPDRILNMMPEYKPSVINDIFTFLDVGILVHSIADKTGIQRKIAQVCLFSRNNEENKIIMLLHQCGGIEQDINLLPEDIKLKFRAAGIENPFVCTGEGICEEK